MNEKQKAYLLFLVALWILQWVIARRLGVPLLIADFLGSIFMYFIIQHIASTEVGNYLDLAGFSFLKKLSWKFRVYRMEFSVSAFYLMVAVLLQMFIF